MTNPNKRSLRQEKPVIYMDTVQQIFIETLLFQILVHIDYPYTSI